MVRKCTRGAMLVTCITTKLQKKFEKIQKTTFFTPKMIRNDPLKSLKRGNFWTKILFFGIIYQPLKLEIQPKVCRLRKKTKFKHFLITPKQIWKSPENDFFDPENGQNDHVTEAKISSKNRVFGGHQKYF